MNKLSIPMLVMAAGMACVAGCADWNNERADGYRSIDQDARADRADLGRPDSTTYADGRAGTAGESPDFYGSSPWSPANRGVSGEQAVGSYPGGATTYTSGQRYPSSGMGSTTPDGRMTTGSYTGATGTQDARGSSPYSPANRGDTSGRTSDTGRAGDRWGTDNQTTTTRDWDNRSTTGTTTGTTSGTTPATGSGTSAPSGTTGTTQDPRGSSPYSLANRGDTTGTRSSDTQSGQTGQMTGREQDSRYTNPNTQDARGSSPYSPANRGDTTSPDYRAGQTGQTSQTGQGQVTGREQDTRYTNPNTQDPRGSSPYSPANRGDTGATGATGAGSTGVTGTGAGSTPSTDSRTGAETRYDNRTSMTDTTDARADHDRATDWRTTSRDASTSSTPDFYGSSPWSPANRGVRITDYTGPDSRPVAHDIAWRSDNRRDAAGRDTDRDLNNRDLNNRGMADRSMNDRTDGRAGDSGLATRMHSSTGYSEGAPGSTAADNTRNAAVASRPGEPPNTVNPAQGQPMDAIGVAPDARILSILHAKNMEEVEMGRLAQNKGASADVRAYGQMLIQDHGQNDEQVQRLAQANNITLLEADQVKQMLKREKDRNRDKDGYLDQHQRNQGRDGQPDQIQNQDAYRDGTPNNRDDRTDDQRADRDRTGQPGMRDDQTTRDGQPGMDKTDKSDKMDKGDHLAHLQTLSGSEFDQAFADKMVKGHREIIRIVEESRNNVTNQDIRGFLDQTLEALRKHEREAQRLTTASR